MTNIDVERIIGACPAGCSGSGRATISIQLRPNLPSSIAHIRSGRFRALAVTSAQRAPELPDVPTMEEAGVPNMVVTAWFGLFAPAGTPQPVIERLQQVVSTILKTPEIRKRFADMGGEAGGNSAAEFGAFVKQQQADWKQIVDTARLSVD